MRVAFVTCGLEHLGVESLAAWVRRHGHEPVVVYEPRPFSSGSGTDHPVLARWLEPTAEETAARVLAARPDVVAFTSYSVTHRWAVSVAREIKRARAVPVVFGGPHVSALPERAIREPAIDAVVEGEGEGALLDLVECAEGGRFGRTDVPNVTFKGLLVPRRNPVRPLIQDLDLLPHADKSGFYGEVPALEREYYVMSRRGCPYRCSFCEYSTFPEQYPGERPVRRRSVGDLIDEMRPWKARGRVRKVFFWDAIFTLDLRWMEEFAGRWRREVGLPFECYTHPQTMTRDMARLLSEAGCIMVRVGVQSVNADTLASMDRRGDQARVLQTLRALTEYGVPYSLDHILGLPGETPQDQLDALRFYNEVRPRRIVAHWMTYFPGTTALRRAREEGLLTDAEVERISDGDVGPGYMFGGNGPAPGRSEIAQLSGVFDLLPILPPEAITWLLEDGRYRRLRAHGLLRQLGVAALALSGEEATREHARQVLATVFSASSDALQRAVQRRLAPTVP